MTPIYFYLDLVAILFPFVLSFDKKVAFYKKWKFLFPSIFITGLFFVLWDMVFTQMKIWSFNPKYLLGYNLGNLPIEEVLFFIVVPYSCLFIYEVLIAYFPHDILKIFTPKLNLYFLIFFLLFGAYFANKVYTVFQCFLMVVLLYYHSKHSKASYLGRFYACYFISLIPFLIMNGILTSLPIVSYDNHFNCGFRIGSIPLEDTFYCMLLLLSNVTFYEYFKNKYSEKQSFKSDTSTR